MRFEECAAAGGVATTNHGELPLSCQLIANVGNSRVGDSSISESSQMNKVSEVASIETKCPRLASRRKIVDRVIDKIICNG